VNDLLFQELGPKAIAKRTATKAGLGLLQDLSKGKTSSNKLALELEK
jgi:hypothetical protein